MLTTGWTRRRQRPLALSPLAALVGRTLQYRLAIAEQSQAPAAASPD